MHLIKAVSDWLKPPQLITQSSALWIVDCFAYAFKYLDKEEFIQRTQLIKPSNQFFPGAVASVEEKAENIFQHSLGFSGLAHWPFQLLHPSKVATIGDANIRMHRDGQLDTARNSRQVISCADFSQGSIFLSYNPQQTLKAEDLAASYGQLFAQHLIYQARHLPPNGAQYLQEASEVVAVFMGFGVMMANSAYTFRGGCGSCFNAASNRQANLTENEIIFALAMFCKLKKITAKEGTLHLKKHLKRPFLTASRQIDLLINSAPHLLKGPLLDLL